MAPLLQSGFGMVRPILFLAFAVLLLVAEVFPPKREHPDPWGPLGRPAHTGAEATRYEPDARYVKEVPASAVAEAPVIPEGERLFAQQGCSGCHGVGAPFHEKLAGAKGKPEQQVAAWILNARAVKPDTLMPPYANQLSEAQARTLAAWVLAGNASAKR